MTINEGRPADRYLLLQINDSLFPIGGYTQSYGLETYVQKGLVKDEATASEYMKAVLKGCFLYTDLLAASIAYDDALAADIENIVLLEQEITAIKVPEEIRTGSHKLGSRFIKTVRAFDNASGGGTFLQYCSELAIIKEPANHCVAYGVFCASNKIGKTEMLETYAYSYASAMATACVKIIPLSQLSGQRMLAACYGLLDEIACEALKPDRTMLGLAQPAYDIRCMQHEDLYSRLYMS